MNDATKLPNRLRHLHRDALRLYRSLLREASRKGVYDFVRAEFLRQARATQTPQVAETRYKVGLIRLEELQRMERVSIVKPNQ